MSEVVFDIESDGLLYEASRIWCIATQDDTWESGFSGPEDIKGGLVHLMEHDMIVGHHIIGYDIPVIQKLYPWFKPKAVQDTSILSRLFWPDLEKQGGHSLEAWAIRLGLDVQKQKHEDWSKYSPEMGTRCQSDVQINKALWDHLQKELNSWDWSRAIKIEYKIAEIHAQQVLSGVQFDGIKAKLLYDEIHGKIQKIEEEVRPELPGKFKQVGVTIKEPFKINGDLKKCVIDWYEEIHNVWVKGRRQSS